MEGARRAGPDDLAVITDLVRLAIAELTPHRGGAVWHRYEARSEPIEPALAELLAPDSTDTLVVVGLIDDTPIGYGVVAIEVLHDGQRLAVVSDLYVLPDARGIGVGEAMMDLLVERAQAAGAVGIDAMALPGDRQTKNFFETFGLTARAIVVHRSFEARADAEL